MRSEKLSKDARDVHHNIGLFLPILLMLASSPIVFGNATKATDSSYSHGSPAISAVLLLLLFCHADRLWTESTRILSDIAAV
jgi:hypothetical protein